MVLPHCSNVLLCVVLSIPTTIYATVISIHLFVLNSTVWSARRHDGVTGTMAMLVLIVIALPGTDADGTDLAALTTSRYKDHTGTMTNVWPEPRSRQGRVLNTYTPLTNSNIQTAAQLWVSNVASATSTYGLVHTWDLSQVTSLSTVWCGYDATQCSAYAVAMRSFNGDIRMWDVSKVTDMNQSKSIRIFENDLT